MRIPHIEIDELFSFFMQLAQSTAVSARSTRHAYMTVIGTVVVQPLNGYPSITQPNETR
jgi:hypothetical protein